MLALTSANATTFATISWALTSVKAIRSAYMYGNNNNHTKYWKYCGKTFSHTPLLVFKIAGITFSSYLRKPCWITGKSLSPKFKVSCSRENSHIYKANADYPNIWWDTTEG